MRLRVAIVVDNCGTRVHRVLCHRARRHLLRLDLHIFNLGTFDPNGLLAGRD